MTVFLVPEMLIFSVKTVGLLRIYHRNRGQEKGFMLETSQNQI